MDDRKRSRQFSAIQVLFSRGSESGSNLELKRFLPVGSFGIQRPSEADFQRPDRRNPAQANPGRIPQVAYLDPFRFLEDITGVCEGEPAQTTVPSRAGKR